MHFNGIEAYQYNFPAIEMHSPVPHSLPSPKNTQSMVMFEEVVSKSFQIIKTILPRVNSLFQLNQELERSVSNIERKLTRLQYDNENLHYQMRTNHLTNQNRYNTILNEYCNINNEASVLKKQAEILAKSVKEVKIKQNIEKKQQQEVQSSDNRIRNFQQRTRKIIYEDEKKGKEDGHREKLFKRNNSIDVEEQEVQQYGKVRFNLHSNISIQISDRNNNFSQKEDQNSQTELNRKSNLKSKKGLISSLSSKKLTKENVKFEQFLKEIENYHFHNQMIKKNYQKLMDQYCIENASQFQQINKKINDLTKRLDQIDPHHNLPELLVKSSQLQFTQNLDQFKKQLNNKVNAGQFNFIIRDLNTRLTKVHEMIQKFANRQQTQKAIMFLENKINEIYEGESEIIEPRKKSIHRAELQKGSLRIVPVPQPKIEKNKINTEINVQTLDNTPRTSRFEQPLVSKKNISSLHTSLSKGYFTQTRRNIERMSLFVEKSQNLDDEFATNRKSKPRELHLLKQKSIQILEKNKTKVRPKLKKERLIFQYD